VARRGSFVVAAMRMTCRSRRRQEHVLLGAVESVEFSTKRTVRAWREARRDCAAAMMSRTSFTLLAAAFTIAVCRVRRRAMTCASALLRCRAGRRRFRLISRSASMHPAQQLARPEDCSWPTTLVRCARPHAHRQRRVRRTSGRVLRSVKKGHRTIDGVWTRTAAGQMTRPTKKRTAVAAGFGSIHNPCFRWSCGSTIVANRLAPGCDVWLRFSSIPYGPAGSHVRL